MVVGGEGERLMRFGYVDDEGLLGVGGEAGREEKQEEEREQEHVWRRLHLLREKWSGSGTGGGGDDEVNIPETELKAPIN